MTTQFGASLTDDARVVIYDCIMFIIHATDERERVNLKCNGMTKTARQRTNCMDRL